MVKSLYLSSSIGEISQTNWLKFPSTFGKFVIIPKPQLPHVQNKKISPNLIKFLWRLVWEQVYKNYQTLYKCSINIYSFPLPFVFQESRNRTVLISLNINLWKDTVSIHQEEMKLSNNIG